MCNKYRKLIYIANINYTPRFTSLLQFPSIAIVYPLKFVLCERAFPVTWLESVALSALNFRPSNILLGFVAPPPFFYLISAASLLAYLLAVEGMKW